MALLRAVVATATAAVVLVAEMAGAMAAALLSMGATRSPSSQNQGHTSHIQLQDLHHHSRYLKSSGSFLGISPAFAAARGVKGFPLTAAEAMVMEAAAIPH